MYKLSKKLALLTCTLSFLILSACSTSVPSNGRDLCSIFQEKDSWYATAHKVHQKYGVPINVAMAIMFHESGFVDDAKPPMRWFLFIPYGRGSSAYGYAQAQDPVWNDYVDEEGSYFSDRDDFDDALDFIAWYMVKTKKNNGIALTDTYRQYLNYHEGWGGFRKGTYKSKDWLLKRAKEVERTANNYKVQILKCNLY